MELKINPDDFNPEHHSSACIILSNDKLLLLKRKSKNSPSGYFWAIPAGHREKDESPQDTLIREMKEELGISLKSYEKITSFNIRLNEKDFVYHLYKATLPETKITLSEEHEDFTWVGKEELQGMELEPGADIYVSFAW